MNKEQIEKEMKKLGKWTAHNIQITQDVSTYPESDDFDGKKSRRFTQMICDIAKRPFGELHILDLACLEGLHAIEFARQGADRVVGIEGRHENIKKAIFARQVLGLDNLELYHDDVRNLTKEKYGYYDVVFCSGILYHLDCPDVFHFIDKMYDVCREILIIDTELSAVPEIEVDYKNNKYWGTWFTEHGINDTPEVKLKRVWSSLDNIKSFWFTKSSLCNLLSHVGFTSVYECHNPNRIIPPDKERVTFLASKGSRCQLKSNPHLSNIPQEDHNENQHNHPDL